MEFQHITYLLDRHIRGELTGKEQQELETLFQDPGLQSVVQAELVRLMGEEAEALAEDGQVSEGDWEPVLQRVLSVDKTAGERGMGRTFRIGWRRWAVAAILLLLIGGGAELFLVRRKAGPAVAVAPAPAAKVIVPGSNKAILTLANGQQIVLNNAQNGMIGQQGGTKVVKLDSGKLAYNSGGGEKSAGAVLYNTITTRSEERRVGKECW